MMMMVVVVMMMVVMVMSMKVVMMAMVVVMMAMVVVMVVVMVENLMLRRRRVGGVDGDGRGGEAEAERRGQQEFLKHLLRP